MPALRVTLLAFGPPVGGLRRKLPRSNPDNEAGYGERTVACAAEHGASSRDDV